MLLLGVTDDTHGSPNFNNPLYSIVYEATGFIGTPQGSLTLGADVQSASLSQKFCTSLELLTGLTRPVVMDMDYHPTRIPPTTARIKSAAI